MSSVDWHPGSWRDKPAAQLPLYADPDALLAAERSLSQAAPIAPIGESEELKRQLAEAAVGRAFLLQGGDCAETFDGPSLDRVQSLADLFAHLAFTLSAATTTPVVRVARIAGQAAKPRGISTEQRGDQSAPVYRGDLVNGYAFDPASRRADPARMLQGHAHALATKALIDRLPSPLFTSHEALLLPYEEPLVRRDAAGGRHWSVSGHFLWVGDRTRQPGGAHVEFLRGIANPIGIKCGPTLTAQELLALCDLLDPDREPGRLTLIVRLGANQIDAVLPGWMRTLKAADRQPLWVCDPMHGNTERGGPRKLRRYDVMLAEVRRFLAIASAEGIWPGGLHLEMTPEPVTECLGGSGPAHPDDLSDWRSACDPRLNGDQALDFAADVARLAAQAVAA
ncbi:3-deoxy-7-phosphoheptulonate synthase [Sphingomonas arenae]|uniref:3-deoxy-7-phosphoheptulonate synthase n=1 Tax=Sphingomonas arenae TaxID=2812555 RepID=UPI0019678639|nr:3-deoxy-7-phosphoheptulonate synthase [Sphingomonas arenae]